MKLSLSKQIITAFVLGIIAFGAFRFLTLEVGQATHVHANFALFDEGQRVDLSGDEYMEDVQGCKPDYMGLQPEERVHMHNNNQNVVHLHDQGVTWGHFFANLGFTLGDQLIVTDDGIRYENTDTSRITYILNGKPIQSIANRLMGNTDQLLISYGSESVSEIIKNQFPVVEDSAKEHNEHPDPGSCSGEIEIGIWEKIKKALWH